jgi:hypothetical protein
MQLPPLSDWTQTRDSLHRVAQIVATIKKARVPKQINALHLSLFVVPEGLTSGRLADGSSLTADFRNRTVRYQPASGEEVVISLEGHSPSSLMDTLLQHIPSGRENIPVPADLGTELLTIDPAAAADYAKALYTIYTALARFRARLLGTMTPLVVWSHGFDLSFLWFRGGDPDEHSQPHLNFGFSPGSEGFPRPYLYAYASPSPDDLTTRALPPPARWYSASWTGAVVDYDQLTSDNPETQIEALAASIYQTLL